MVRLGRGTQQLLRVAAAAGPGATQPLLAVVAAGQACVFAQAQLQLERVVVLWDRVPGAGARAGMDRVSLLSRCAEAAYATSATSGSPVAARASRWRSQASSWTRPMNRPAVTWQALTPGMPRRF